ncbi:ribose ABC transport system [Cutibacterium acnes JCM 18918]|nr:ribose ABC transport system [Cutibacterium acnes JCM 18918]
MSGGSGKASGTFIGAVLLAVIRNGLNILNVSSFWQQVVIGCVIALAVGFDVFRSKKES